MKKWTYVLAPLLIGLAIGTFVSRSMLQGNDRAPAVANVAEQGSYRAVVKRVLPAVVSIEAKSKRQSRTAAQANSPRDSVAAPDRPPTQTGVGSGVVVDPKGVILTNYHVVRGADKVIVRTHDGTQLTSKNVKVDPKSDLAVVIVEPKKPLPYLLLGDSDQMEIGDRVLAVGAPFGLVGSVTSGIISGKGRSLQMNVYEDFLQTDAAINPGNSGGPLINLDGKVVGISTAIKSRSGGFQGVGLAISTKLIKSVMPKLLQDGAVKRGYLGAQVKDLTDPEIAKRLGMRPGQQGVLVTQVYVKTPADKAGIKDGDVILSIGGKSISDGRELQFAILALPLNRAVGVELLRDGKRYQADVMIEEQPDRYGTSQVAIPRAPDKRDSAVLLDKIGVEVVDLTATLADRLGYARGTRGVLITKVDGDGAGAISLEAGMLILKIDGAVALTAEACKRALAQAALEQGVLLQVYTPQGGTNFVLLRSSR